MIYDFMEPFPETPDLNDCVYGIDFDVTGDLVREKLKCDSAHKQQQNYIEAIQNWLADEIAAQGAFDERD